MRRRSHAPPLREHARDRDALDDRRALLPRALGQRHGDVDGVHAAVVGDVEAGEHVVGAAPSGNSSPTSRRRDLVDVDTAIAVEAATRRYSSSRSVVGGELDEPTGLKPVDWPGLRLELARRGRACTLRISVDVSEVEPKHDHQSRGVPRRARRQLVALEQHDIVVQPTWPR